MTGSINWTDKELDAAVEAYIELRSLAVGNLRVPKRPIIDRLLAGPLSTRTRSSIERRFSNISYVMESIGEGWVKGYKPLSNVGARVHPRLERMIKLHLTKQSGKELADDALVDELVFDRLVRELRGSVESIERPIGAKVPKKIVRVVNDFARSPAVKAYVLRRANGRCEVCSLPAPFIDADGFPFLEVHHVKPLSEGGSDLVENTIAACPNCHRRAHLARDRSEFIESLYRKLPFLRKE